MFIKNIKNQFKTNRYRFCGNLYIHFDRCDSSLVEKEDTTFDKHLKCEIDYFKIIYEILSPFGCEFFRLHVCLELKDMFKVPKCLID